MVARLRFVPMLAGALVGGCLPSTAVPRQAESNVHVEPAAPSPPPVAAERVRLERALGSSRSGSKVTLARARGHTLAIVSDTDADAVHVVDIDAGKTIARHEVRKPAGIVLLADGRFVVPSRAESAVEIVALDAADTLHVERMITTGGDPVAIALTPDDATLLVATSADAALEAYDPSTGARTSRVALKSSPSAVTTDPEGRRALVASATASAITSVDLAGGSTNGTNLDATGADAEPLGSFIFGKGSDGKMGWAPAYGMGTNWQIHELGQIRARARHASAFASVAEVVYVAHELLIPTAPPSDLAPEPTAYGGAGTLSSSEFLGVSILDTRTGKRISFHGADRRCRLPRGQVFDEAKKQLFVACAGTNNVVALSWSPNVTWRAGALFRDTPSFHVVSSTDLPEPGDGVALDTENRRLVVSTLFGSQLAVRRLDRPDDARGATTLVALEHDGHAPQREAFARGRALFHRAADPRIAKDGRACASCHIEGLSDNLVWRTKRGSRSTPVLAGRLDRSGAFGWNGESKDLATHVVTTITKNLDGKGLTPQEIDDLSVYLRGMAVPSTGSHSPLAERGEAVFRSAAAGCATCHLEGGRSTDEERHVLGPGASFLTPSLLGLGRSAPYFHDGRYASLDELLTKTDGRMGATRSLSTEDRAALVAYLQSL